MKKKFFYMLLVSLATIGFTACSDNDDDYNANTAVSPYEPAQGRRMVAQIKTTNTVDGRDYSWEHNFQYDAQNRIRQIDSRFVHYRAVKFANTTRFYRCNITSQANYYFEDEKFRVEYTLSREYPEFPEWNSTESGKDHGLFNSNGTLAKISAIDLEYNATQLQRAYSDGGIKTEVARDASGNVTGYRKYRMMNAEQDTLIIDRSNDFRYYRDANRTNFDFSSYFGYWGIDQLLYANNTEYYASYQLAAFGFFGATSSHLPYGMLARDGKGNVVMESGTPKYLYGNWEFDSQNCPVSFTDGTGRRTEITYIE
jgi:hypothetical protein